MKSRRLGILAGLVALLGVWYAWSFTEWIRPEPIEIVPQFRPLPKAILQRMAKETTREARPIDPKPVLAPVPVQADGPVPPNPKDTAHRGEAGGNTAAKKPVKITPARSRNAGLLGAGRDVQPFIFSLDGKYQLTSIRVTDVSPTNPTPRLAWSLRSKSGSPPTDTILYGRAPDTMAPLTVGFRPDRLLPGHTYTIYLEAGRRRGQKSFVVPQEAEPVDGSPGAADDGDYKPEKDIR